MGRTSKTLEDAAALRAKIERLREAGISHKAIAARLGMSPGYISKVLTAAQGDRPDPGK